jgi:hypothetical protein
MNRVALYELCERIKGNAALAQHFLSNDDSDVRVVAELIGRCDIIESKVAEVRGRLEQPDKAERPGLHVLGHRPPTDAA